MLAFWKIENSSFLLISRVGGSVKDLLNLRIMLEPEATMIFTLSRANKMKSILGHFIIGEANTSNITKMKKTRAGKFSRSSGIFLKP